LLGPDRFSLRTLSEIFQVIRGSDSAQDIPDLEGINQGDDITQFQRLASTFEHTLGSFQSHDWGNLTEPLVMPATVANILRWVREELEAMDELSKKEKKEKKKKKKKKGSANPLWED
jgi:hypothetical protein